MTRRTPPINRLFGLWDYSRAPKVGAAGKWTIGQKEILMRTLFLLTLTTLAAAATGCMSEVKSSDSGKTYTYDCSGLGKGWGDCSAKADAECGAHNYAVVSRTGEADEKSSSGNTEMKRTMVVSCNRK
jgi:hypothetical protein